jgi:hypothetical protein
MNPVYFIDQSGGKAPGGSHFYGLMKGNNICFDTARKLSIVNHMMAESLGKAAENSSNVSE